MSHFIRLSNRIINVNTVRTVWQNSAKQTYEIEFINLIYLVTYNKNKHPEDYTIIDTWYNSFNNRFTNLK